METKLSESCVIGGGERLKYLGKLFVIKQSNQNVVYAYVVYATVCSPHQLYVFLS